MSAEMGRRWRTKKGGGIGGKVDVRVYIKEQKMEKEEEDSGERKSAENELLRNDVTPSHKFATAHRRVCLHY